MPDVEQAFKVFLEGMRVPDSFVYATAERSEALRDFLKREIRINKIFPGGSYRRGTCVFPFNSVKLHVALNPKHYYECRKNSWKVLSFLKAALAGGYPNVRIGREGQTVTVPISGGPDIELAPSLKLSTGNYLVPNGIGGWFRANPARQEAIFNSKEEESDGKFKNLIKILKSWNLNAGRPFNSYFLELLAYYRANDFSGGYGRMVTSLFRSMTIFLPEFLSCPVVKAPISVGDMSVIDKLVENARDVSESALGRTGNEEAVILWKSLLGDRFS
ncbi:MAG: SMODS domain-containing nucleotidyltransferase [Bacillota bacterium]